MMFLFVKLGSISEKRMSLSPCLKGTRMTDGKAKSLVAYHEVGHAICGTLCAGHDPVQKVTLVPRGQAKAGAHTRPLLS